MEFQNVQTKSASEIILRKQKLCNYLYSYFQYLLNLKTNNSNQLEKFKNKLIVAYKLRDYEYVLTKMNEVEILKILLLNKCQQSAFRYFKKPVDCETESLFLETFQNLLKVENKSKENMIEYYADLISNDSLIGHDQTLYENLEDEIKKEIFTKVGNKSTKNIKIGDQKERSIE